MGEPKPIRTVRVVRTEQLSPSMVRVVVGGPDLAALPSLEFTDHYVKLLFAGVKRTYTIRWLDTERLEMAIDFVIHGDQGLAGPWAAHAKPGDELRFVGPGGKWAPREDADVHVLIGDEAALPAIAVALEALPATAQARVFLEVASAADRVPLPQTDHTEVTWVHREELRMGYGEALTYAVQSATWPDGDVEAFVHGNADMIKPLRHYLFHELGIPKEHVSISGYWRTGLDEDRWQSSKAEFVAQMEAEQDGAPA